MLLRAEPQRFHCDAALHYRVERSNADEDMVDLNARCCPDPERPAEPGIFDYLTAVPEIPQCRPVLVDDLIEAFPAHEHMVTAEHS